MFHFRHKNEDKDASKTGDQGSHETREAAHGPHESYGSHEAHGSHEGRGSHEGHRSMESHSTHQTSGHGDPLMGATHGSHSHQATHDPHSSAGQHQGSQSTTQSMRQTADQAASKITAKAKQAFGSKSSSESSGTANQLPDGLRRSAERTMTYLNSVKEVVANHDREHNQSSSSSSSEIKHEISSTESAVESMKRLSEEIRRKGNNVSDSMVDEARKAVEDMVDKLNGLAASTRPYEDDHSTTSPSTFQAAKEKLVGATQSAQSSAVSAMVSTREMAQSGFEALKQQLSPSQYSESTATKEGEHGGMQTVKEKTADTADAAKQKVHETVPGSQEQQGPGMKEKATQMLNTSLDYVAGTLHSLKVESSEPSTTDKAKDSTHSMASTAKDKAHEMTTDNQHGKTQREQSPLSSYAP